MKHIGPISGVATYKNYITTTGYDNQVILWDAKTGRSLARALHDHLANQCSFSHDGALLVSAGSDYSARIWEIPSMQLKAALVGHSDDVDTAVFSPDDQYIATCALDRTLKIFDLGGRCLKTLTGHTGNVLTVAWSPDGKTLISSSVDGTVRHWDVLTGRQIHCTNEGARTDTFETASDGCMFSGDDRGRIAIIEGDQTHFVAAHKAGIKKLLLKDTLLVTISYDRSIAFWRINRHDGELPALTEISRSTLPALIWARAAAFLDDKIVLGTFGSRYATFDWQQGIWDLSNIEPSKSLNAVATIGADVYAVGDAGTVFKNGAEYAEMGSLCNFLLAAGDKLLTGGQMGILFDAATGESLYEHHSPLNCGATFYRNGKLHAAIGSYTGEVLVFALDQGLHLLSSHKLYENAVKGLAANDTVLFSVCANTNVVWQDINTLEVIKVIENAHERIANGCCRVGTADFASIGRDLKLVIYTNGHGKVADLDNVNDSRRDFAHGDNNSQTGHVRPPLLNPLPLSGEEVNESLREFDIYDSRTAYQTPHPNSVKCIAVSSDGKRIMTGSYGGTLAGFDVTTRTWASFSRPTAWGISALAYHPQQDRFLASCYDGNIHPVDETHRCR